MTSGAGARKNFYIGERGAEGLIDSYTYMSPVLSWPVRETMKTMCRGKSP